MCLAVPCKVVAINGTTAQVNYGGNVLNVDISMLPDVKVDQYVIVHAGIALQVYSEKEAQETLELLDLYFNPDGEK
jgi:hydrogenase expression/formation protein HypC